MLENHLGMKIYSLLSFMNEYDGQSVLSSLGAAFWWLIGGFSQKVITDGSNQPACSPGSPVNKFSRSFD